MKNNLTKYVAYFSANHEFEEFDTLEEAKGWLQSIYDEDGEFSEETVHGYDYIAEIILRSKYTIIDKKSNYTEEELEDEWAYSDEYDEVGCVEMVDPIKLNENEEINGSK